MKNNTKHQKRKIKKTLEWLGQQNIFVILFFCLVVFFMGKSVYASFNQPDISEKKAQELKQKVTPTPKPTFKAFPTTSPKPNKVLFSGDPDPVISCNIPLRCGGSKSVKLSECYSKTCCLVEPNVYEYIEYSECSKRQKVYWDKRFQESRESLEETMKQYNEFVEGINKATEEMNSTLKTSAPLIKNTYDEEPLANLYLECIGDAKQKYTLACNATNVCGDCYGYGCPDTTLANETKICQQRYGLIND